MCTLTPARGGGAGGWEEPTHAARLGKTKTKLKPERSLEIVRDHFRASVSFLPFGVENADFTLLAGSVRIVYRHRCPVGRRRVCERLSATQINTILHTAAGRFSHVLTRTQVKPVTVLTFTRSPRYDPGRRFIARTSVRGTSASGGRCRRRRGRARPADARAASR